MLSTPWPDFLRRKIENICVEVRFGREVEVHGGRLNDSRKSRYATTMAGKIRIIAGAWRGRKLEVMDLPGLRPSGDRSRETLFNWIGPSIHGLRCLDLFAGTGALGLEAVSRGAAEAVLVERSGLAVKHLVKATENWPGIDCLRIVSADALDWIHRDREAFDLIFLDPPHQQGLQIDALKGLVEAQRLAPEARVCIEHGVQEDWLGDERDWFEARFELLKQARFGKVELGLLQSTRL